MAGPSILSIIDILPQILSVAQAAMYLVLVWILGSLAVRGLKKDIPLAIKIAVMFGSGFLCVIAGVSLSVYLTFLKGTLLETIHMDTFIVGLLASVTMAASFYIITRGEGKINREETIKTLKQRVCLLEGILLQEKAHILKEKEVRKTAETLLPGYTAKEAKLEKTDWEIILQKGDKRAAVLIGAYTGEVKAIHKQGSRILKDPLKIVGIAIILALLTFSIINFRGFPSMMDSMASLMGMEPDELNSLIGGTEDMPSDCVPTVRILMSKGLNVFGGSDSYENEALKQMIESETDRRVLLMYQTDYNGREYVLSVTMPKDADFSQLTNDDIIKQAEICSSTGETLCDCIQVPDINVPTGFIIA